MRNAVQEKITKKSADFKANKAEQAKVERLKLMALSQKMKEIRALHIASSKTPEEVLYHASMTINQLLINAYKAESGAIEFQTFKQWKEAGYSVKKGSKAFRVWSAPLKGKSTVEMVDLNTKQAEDVEQQFEFWGVCCLFSDLQVEKINGDEPNKTPSIPLEKEQNQNTEDLGQTVEEEVNIQSQVVSEVVATEQEAEGGSSKTALKLRNIAESLTAPIEKCFAQRLSNTPKRMAQSATARAEGERLTRTQKAAYALAELHEAGQVPAILAKVQSKKAIYELVGAEKEMVPNGYHCYAVDTGRPALKTPEAQAIWALLDGKTPEQMAKDQLQRKVDAVRFSKIEGYFPTQGEALEILLDHADLSDGLSVADTSAGSGHIADAIKARFDVQIEVFEINPTLSKILSLKGYAAKNADFLKEEARAEYDRIVINPPFERLQDLAHVMHSFKFLKPGGKLAAIVSPSGFFRNDKKSSEFRAWFDSVGGEVQDMPSGSFKASGTNVETKLITICKP